MAKCEHGVSHNDGRFVGQWNAPFSRCKCCGVNFPYIDQGSYTTARMWSRMWTPKDLCGACGGKYEETEYVAHNERNIRI